MFAVFYGVGRTWRLKPESKAEHALYKGETAVLTIKEGDTGWLARNMEDCDSPNVAMARKDDGHLRGCEEAQTAFRVPAGTFVKVIGTSVSRIHVEVLDGPRAGQTGWVEFEYLGTRQRGEYP